LFCGTTVENFRASIIKKGEKIIYSRSKDHPGISAGTYFDLKGLEYPAAIALSRAMELSQTPLIYSVHLWKRSRYFKENPYAYWLWLPPEVSAQVSRLWVSVDDWKSVDLWTLNDDERVALFKEVPRNNAHRLLEGRTLS
jgi:hypothetical protein